MTSDGKIKTLPKMTNQEFDDWYDTTYGYGTESNRILLFIGIIVFAVACFVTGWAISHDKKTNVYHHDSYRQR